MKVVKKVRVFRATTNDGSIAGCGRVSWLPGDDDDDDDGSNCGVVGSLLVAGLGVVLCSPPSPFGDV